MTDRPGRKDRTGKAEKKPVIVLVVVIAALAMLMPWAMGLGEKNRVEMRTFQSGQLVVIKKAIIAGASEADYYKVFEISVSKDTQALIQMVKEGKAFSIPMGSKVRIEKRHLGNCEITVMDGAMVGKFGWVPIGIMR